MWHQKLAEYGLNFYAVKRSDSPISNGCYSSASVQSLNCQQWQQAAPQPACHTLKGYENAVQQAMGRQEE